MVPACHHILLDEGLELGNLKPERHIDEPGYFPEVVLLARVEHESHLRRATAQDSADLKQFILVLRRRVQLLRDFLYFFLCHAFLKEDERRMDTVIEHLVELFEGLGAFHSVTDLRVWPAHHQVAGNVIAPSVDI